jgi:putative membrane protein
MTVDALLAILHHLAVFALVALLFVEFTLLHGTMDGVAIRRFGQVDAMYGLTAVVVIAVGVSRVIWGAVPADVYLGNLFFWTKMGALGAVALVSIRPTMRGSGWRKALALDPGFLPPAADVAVARRALHVELVILPLIPVSAALMARGIGAF